MFGGVDHNFVIEGRGMRTAAICFGDKTGIKMEVITNCAGIQIYTDNGVEKERTGKNGMLYRNHGGICLETQVFSDSIKYAHFTKLVLKRGDNYKTETEYKFSLC